MTASASSKLSIGFWTVAIAAVAWNLLGVAAFLMDVTTSEEALSALPEAQRALREAQPAWVTGAFAIAVFAGLVGSFALALRNRLATSVLAISLAAVFVQMYWTFFMADTLAIMGAASAVVPGLVIAIGAFLVLFSAGAGRRGLLK